MALVLKAEKGIAKNSIKKLGRSGGLDIVVIQKGYPRAYVAIPFATMVALGSLAVNIINRAASFGSDKEEARMRKIRAGLIMVIVLGLSGLSYETIRSAGYFVPYTRPIASRLP